jgi:DHA2 family multidrug resistance protein
MNFELSMNVAASLEGWYIENWSWKWIFWQNALLGAAMLACVIRGTPREPIDWAIFRRADWPGTIYASVGLSLLYAGLDQGNRLDWTNSGLIVGLLLGGSVLLLLFLVHQLTTDRPALNLAFLARGNIPLLVVLFTALRTVMLATSYVIPQYLVTIQGFRALQIGQVLIWIALPQFLLAPFIAVLLQRVDPRYPLALGLALIGVACWMGTYLTAYWTTPEFLPAQIVQAVGQSFAMTSLVVFNIRNSSPAEALSFGAMFQATRLLGGEIGYAAMQEWIRVREAFHASVIGGGVPSGAPATVAQLQEYAAAVAGGSNGAAEASSRAAALLARTVQQQAYVLAFVDGFVLIGAVVIACLSLLLLLRPAPRPG